MVKAGMWSIKSPVCKISACDIKNNIRQRRQSITANRKGTQQEYSPEKFDNS